MSLQFRRYHYSESNRGDLLRLVICKLHSTDTHSHYKVYIASAAFAAFLRLFVAIFFSSYCILDVIAVSLLIVWFAFIGFAELRSLRERPHIVKTVRDGIIKDNVRA